jgi:hypothetical protein
MFCFPSITKERIDQLSVQFDVMKSEMAFQNQKIKELQTLLALEQEKTEQIQKLLISIESKLPPKWATTAAMAAGTVTAVGITGYTASSSGSVPMTIMKSLSTLFSQKSA